VDGAVLEGLRERLVQLESRVAAADDSIVALRAVQRQMGLGLRSDIAAAQTRMLSYLKEAQAALAASNADGTKKNLDSAERALEVLEKFLGR
jgi:hypothetical protein